MILLERLGLIVLVRGGVVWLENISGDFHAIEVLLFAFCVNSIFFHGVEWLTLMFNIQLGPKFMKDNGLEHVAFSTADGALEAAPAVRWLYII